MKPDNAEDALVAPRRSYNVHDIIFDRQSSLEASSEKVSQWNSNLSFTPSAQFSITVLSLRRNLQLEQLRRVGASFLDVVGFVSGPIHGMNISQIGIEGWPTLLVFRAVRLVRASRFLLQAAAWLRNFLYPSLVGARLVVTKLSASIVVSLLPVTVST